MKLWTFAKKCGSWLWKAVVAIGVILGILAVYYQFFSSPNISSQIISEVNVFDVRQTVADFQIVFRGNNIQEQNRNLRIYQVRYENDGRTDITQNDFDQINNWGLRIENGEIVETRLADTNSDYISANLNPHVQNSVTLNFNRIIFDREDYFTIELLVLHDKQVEPTLYRVGKIAGVKEIENRILTAEKNEPFFRSVLYGIFYGTGWVASVRFFLYFTVSVVLFIIVFAVAVSISQRREKAKQRPQAPQQPSH